MIFNRKLLLLVFFYYFFSLLISVFLIILFFSRNNPVSLDFFINNDELEFNIKNNILRQDTKIKNKIKNFNIKSNNIEFSGELSDSYLNKIIDKYSKTISKDFSKSKVIIYFYYNSDKIEDYLTQYFYNLYNEYNFDLFILNNKTKIDNKQQSINKNNFNNQKQNKNILDEILFQIRSKSKNIKYFFFTSPFHFKLSVLHKNILFNLNIKFNGLYWSIYDINFNYKKLINISDII